MGGGEGYGFPLQRRYWFFGWTIPSSLALLIVIADVLTRKLSSIRFLFPRTQTFPHNEIKQPSSKFCNHLTNQDYSICNLNVTNFPIFPGDFDEFDHTI